MRKFRDVYLQDFLASQDVNRGESRTGSHCYRGAQSTTEPQNHLLLLACFSGKIFKRTAGDFKERGGDGGAIRPKIAIFKEEKWVCYGAKILRELRCYNISAGGDLMKNHDFHKGKMVAVGCFSKHFSDGNDATESDDFQKLKQDNQKLWGTMRQKMAIFKG